MGHSKRCFVRSCKNHKTNPGVRLYKFPQDTKLFKTWMNLLTRDPKLSAQRQPYICKDHFLHEELHTIRCRLLKEETKCRCLVQPGVVPTLNMPEIALDTVERLQSYQRQENHKIATELLSICASESPPTEFNNNESVSAALGTAENGTLSAHVCTLCMKTFDCEEDLQEHVAKGHIFTCLSCDFSVCALEKSQFEEHYRTFHGQSSNTDNDSIQSAPENSKDFQGSALNNKLLHIKSTEDVSINITDLLCVSIKLVCTVCNRKFKNEEVLLNHKCRPPKKVRKPTKMFRRKCELCGDIYVSKYEFKLHMKTKHELYITCSNKDCFAYFSTDEEATLHYKTHKKVFLCEKCGKAYTNRKGLRQHIMYKHENKAGIYKCNLCGKIYKYDSKYTNHMKLHRGENPYNCRFCKATFLKEFEYHKHVVRDHEDKAFNCNECSQKFAVKGHLFQHMKRAHINTVSYSCSICYKLFKTSLAARLHFQNHSTEEKSQHVNCKFYKTSLYQCKICFVYVKNYSHLRSHCYVKHRIGVKQYENLENDTLAKLQVKHKKILVNQPLQCPICDKICQNPTGYWQHIKIHSNVCKFNCKVCKKGFPTLSQMKAHYRCAHLKQDIVYTCDKCGEHFSCKKNLMKHILHYHL